MADQPDEPLFGTIHSPGVTVFSSDRAAARALARRIAVAVQAKPRLVLGLPTGKTPVALYHELASLHAHGHADFSQVTTFNLDEFLGIPPSHPGSYRSFMERHLFSRVNIPPEHTNFLDGSAADPEAECARYEKQIADVGWIDLQVLGIGTNGHIGFNEPARVLQSRTHRVVLRPETRRSNASLFGGDPAMVPAEALSMGMATILKARSIVLLATGRTKAGCVEGVVNGPLTTELPASFLQLHHDLNIMLDEAAAERLGDRRQETGDRR
jgi:glucosamine-6-phosphate deaminase